MPFANVSSVFTLLIAINVAVFSFLTIALVVAVAYVRSRNRAQRVHDEHLQATWREIFARARNGAPLPDPLPAIEFRNVFTVLHLFNEIYHPELDGIAAKAGIPSQALRLLELGDDPERIVALNTLGRLRERGALARAQSLIDDEGTELSRSAAECALRIDFANLARVLTAVSKRPDWVRSRVEAMLHEVPVNDLGVAIATRIEASAGERVRRLLDYVRLCTPIAARRICRFVLNRSSDPETIAAALRALAPVSAGEDRELALRFCSHNDPIVLLAALRVLRRSVRPDDRDLLERLTAHRDYWVRLRAAEAVVALYGPDELAATFIAQHHDRFARDAVRAAIAENKLLRRVQEKSA